MQIKNYKTSPQMTTILLVHFLVGVAGHFMFAYKGYSLGEDFTEALV